MEMEIFRWNYLFDEFIADLFICEMRSWVGIQINFSDEATPIFIVFAIPLKQTLKSHSHIIFRFSSFSNFEMKMWQMITRILSFS
jgi:hypothetical protein